MIRVSFTKFLDFIAQTGEPKAETAISAWRQSNTPYDPKRDYHKRMRTALIEALRNGQSPNWEEFIELQNEKKRKNFSDTITKFEEWKETYSSIHWFEPPRATWSSTEFQITVNPELGLSLDGNRVVVKLYLNRVRISSLKAQTGGLIMEQALRPLVENSTSFAVYDIKAERFHLFDGASEHLRYNLIGESANMSAIIGAVRAA
ncbi:MAG: hypothetical protein AAF230_01020 [Pseudomonadota bacterium]